MSAAERLDVELDPDLLARMIATARRPETAAAIAAILDDYTPKGAVGSTPITPRSRPRDSRVITGEAAG